jgi:hypothetical protein
MKARLWKAFLHKANLSEANLSGAHLIKAKLVEAHLHRVDLHEANLSGANLSRAYLSKANLSGADLSEANLNHANLRHSDLSDVDFSNADLSGANLRYANLSRANLSGADLSGAHLTKAKLIEATLVKTNFEKANLTDSRIYGISAWNLNLNDATQSGLIISNEDEPNVTVDDVEVAQFVYLLLNRKKLRNVLDTITSKAVLILGRFTPERKAVLEAMADELRKHNLLPIIFDFERSTDRDFTETIKVLAGISLFVIVDITKPKSTPFELQAVVPDYQIPFVPIIEKGEKPFSMFKDLPKYDWVLTPVVAYPSLESLLKGFKEHVINRAWKKHKELQKSKAQDVEILSIDDFTKNDKNKTDE